jgi:hypothetical protein
MTGEFCDLASGLPAVVMSVGIFRSSEKEAGVEATVSLPYPCHSSGELLSDTFAIQGQQKSGFKASVDQGRLDSP